MTFAIATHHYTGNLNPGTPVAIQELVETGPCKYALFDTLEAARAYLPKFAAWHRDGYKNDLSWERWNRFKNKMSVLIVKYDDRMPAGYWPNGCEIERVRLGDIDIPQDAAQ